MNQSGWLQPCSMPCTVYPATIDPIQRRAFLLMLVKELSLCLPNFKPVAHLIKLCTKHAFFTRTRNISQTVQVEIRKVMPKVMAIYSIPFEVPLEQWMGWKEILCCSHNNMLQPRKPSARDQSKMNLASFLSPYTWHWHSIICKECVGYTLCNQDWSMWYLILEMLQWKNEQPNLDKSGRTGQLPVAVMPKNCLREQSLYWVRRQA